MGAHVNFDARSGIEANAVMYFIFIEVVADRVEILEITVFGTMDFFSIVTPAQDKAPPAHAQVRKGRLK